MKYDIVKDICHKPGYTESIHLPRIYRTKATADVACKLLNKKADKFTTYWVQPI